MTDIISWLTTYFNQAFIVSILIWVTGIYLLDYIRARKAKKQEKIIDLEVKIIDSYHQALLDIERLNKKIKESAQELKAIERQVDKLGHLLITINRELHRWEEEYPPSIDQIQKLRAKVKTVLDIT